VTVHWFVHPLWFQDIGAFTKEENIEVFVEWAKLAFTLFGALTRAAPSTLCRPRHRPRNRDTWFQRCSTRSSCKQRLHGRYAEAEPTEHGAKVLSASNLRRAVPRQAVKAVVDVQRAGRGGHVRLHHRQPPARAPNGLQGACWTPYEPASSSWKNI